MHHFDPVQVAVRNIIDKRYGLSKGNELRSESVLSANIWTYLIEAEWRI